MVDIHGNKDDRFIPGFIKIAQEQYGMTEEEALETIKSFLVVIKDASDYLFSRNHAVPYSMIGFFIGWLRYYYKIELLTSALNVYSENNEKMASIKEYIKSQGIEVKNIKFGKSRAEYFMDKDENAIYQGIASIKYCNSQIAEELYQLSKNKYNNFVELIIDINEKTSVDIRQLTILTGLNFFEEFGKNKYLLDIIELCNGIKKGTKVIRPALLTCKVLKKNKLDDYGISEYLAQKYSGKETAAQYSQIDNIGLITELSTRLENKSLSVVEQVKFEQEFLNYVVYTNPKVHEHYYIVTEYKTFKEVRKPYITVHNIKTEYNPKGFRSYVLALVILVLIS